MNNLLFLTFFSYRFTHKMTIQRAHLIFLNFSEIMSQTLVEFNLLLSFVLLFFI